MQLKIEKPNHQSPQPDQAFHPEKSHPKLPKMRNLAIACILASALGAATVITAENAFQVADKSFVPKPQRASKVPSSTFTTATKSHNQKIRFPNPPNTQALYLVRSTLLALNQANQTGNYSVLRALGTPQFSARNSPADLAIIFSNLRRSKIDLAEVALLTPKWQHPKQTQDNGLRLRGVLPMRAREIFFDLHFKSISGLWRIFALHVSPSPQDGRKTIHNVSRKKTQPATKAGPMGQSSKARDGRDARAAKTLMRQKNG